MTRRSKADWQKLIEQQVTSPLTIAEFCKHHELAQSYFYKRKSELKQSEINLPVDISPLWLAEFIKALA